jgi:hypothetical protein
VVYGTNMSDKSDDNTERFEGKSGVISFLCCSHRDTDKDVAPGKGGYTRGVFQA